MPLLSPKSSRRTTRRGTTCHRRLLQTAFLRSAIRRRRSRASTAADFMILGVAALTVARYFGARPYRDHPMSGASKQARRRLELREVDALRGRDPRETSLRARARVRRPGRSSGHRTASTPSQRHAQFAHGPMKTWSRLGAETGSRGNSSRFTCRYREALNSQAADDTPTCREIAELTTPSVQDTPGLET
jgi:hypothetical protein